MRGNDFVAIALFLCVTYGFIYVVKAIVDARMRHLLSKAGSSTEMLQAIINGEELQRRHTSLRWGLVLVALAIAFGFIQAFGWNEINAGSIALLAGATGLGNLVFFAISSKLKL